MLKCKVKSLFVCSSCSTSLPKPKKSSGQNKKPEHLFVLGQRGRKKKSLNRFKTLENSVKLFIDVFAYFIRFIGFISAFAIKDEKLSFHSQNFVI